MSDDVKLVFTGDSASAEKALANLERKYDALEARMKRMGKQSKDSAKESADAWMHTAAQVGAVAAGGLAAIIKIQEQVDESAKQASRSVDELNRKVQATASLSEAQSAAAQASVDRVAIANAVPRARARAAQLQMISTGFSADEASGASLNELFKFQAAMAASGKSANEEETALRLSGYLESQGMGKTGASIREIGQQIFAMRAGNLQISDLEFLAKEGATLATGINSKEQLAGFTSLLDLGMKGEPAAVGLRNVVSRLQTAGGQAEKVAALDLLGLKPEQVDFVGENLNDVLGTMRAATAKVPENVRNIALDKLVGDQARGPMLALMQADASGKFDEYVRLAGQPGDYDRSAEIMQSGPTAAEMRQTAQREAFQEKQYRGRDLYLNRFEQQLRDEGYSEWRVQLKMGRLLDQIPLVGPLTGLFPTGASDFANFMSPERAIRMSSDFGSSTADRAIQGVEQDLGGASEIKKLRKSLDDNTKATQDATKLPPIDRNAQVE